MEGRSWNPLASRLIRKTIERELADSRLERYQQEEIRIGFLWHEPPERVAARVRLDPRIISLWYHRLALRTAYVLHRGVRPER